MRIASTLEEFGRDYHMSPDGTSILYLVYPTEWGTSQTCPPDESASSRGIIAVGLELIRRRRALGSMCPASRNGVRSLPRQLPITRN